MPSTLRELAALVGGVVQGDGDLPISGAATLRLAQPGEITLADKPDLAAKLTASQAAAVVVSDNFQPTDRPYIVVDKVHTAFAAIVRHLRPPRQEPARCVHAGAMVSPTARLGENVAVHPGAFVGDDVEIGAGATIHSGARILAGSVIGAGATIFPNAVLYENTLVGERSIIHAGAVLGSHGFGYETRDGRHLLGAQLGWVEIGADVEIGANCTIDRGTYGPTIIEEGTKLDNLCHIAHNVRIGKHNLLCAQVGVAGSSTTGDYVVLAGQVGVRDHVDVGSGAVIGAKGGVRCDIPAGERYIGIPAIPEREQAAILFALSKLPTMRKEFRKLQDLVEKLAGEGVAHGASERAA